MEYHWILLSVFLQFTFHPGKTELLRLMQPVYAGNLLLFTFEQRKGSSCLLMTTGTHLPLAQSDKDNPHYSELNCSTCSASPSRCISPHFSLFWEAVQWDRDSDKDNLKSLKPDEERGYFGWWSGCERATLIIHVLFGEQGAIKKKSNQTVEVKQDAE